MAIQTVNPNYRESELDKLFNSNSGNAPDMGNSWMDTLFGTKERAGAIQVGSSAIGGIVNSWLGYEQLQLAQENTELAKQQFQQNKELSSMEAALKLDARKRGLAKHGISSNVVDTYAAKYQ